MKTLLASIIALIASCALSATITFHAAKDVGLIDVNWDSWHWEVTYGIDNGPWTERADAWFMCDASGPNYVQPGQTCTAIVPDGLVGEYWGWNYAPDFTQTTTSATVPAGDGEYWLDFDANGPRVSMSQPADFGKFMWDGSINPSWVEPLAKRGKAKGHH